jgi:hypothetical protein
MAGDEAKSAACCTGCGSALSPQHQGPCPVCGHEGKTISVQAQSSITLSASARLDSRYSFTHQFIDGARMFAADAEAIENSCSNSVSEKEIIRHRSVVTAAVMQSAAALEAEVFEVLEHGPGHHKGSDGVDAASRDFLRPLADLIDKLPATERFQQILHLTRKPLMDRGASVFRNMTLVIRLRNEITHYKSLWGEDQDRQKFIKQLHEKRFRSPPFVSSSSNFFPHHVLGADCALWSFESAVNFLSEFYRSLGFPCRMEKYHASGSSK